MGAAAPALARLTKRQKYLFSTRHTVVGFVCYAFSMKKTKISSSPASLPSLYPETLEDLKRRVRHARLKTVLRVNRELILLYWEIGRLILDRQNNEGWGSKVVERLAHDLSAEFPDMRGFSLRNLLFMRSFAEAFTSGPIVKQLVSQLPWGHIIRILQQVKSPAERSWAANEFGATIQKDKASIGTKGQNTSVIILRGSV